MLRLKTLLALLCWSCLSQAQAFDQCLKFIDEAATMRATALGDETPGRAEGLAIYVTMRGFAGRGCAKYPEMKRLRDVERELDELLLSDATAATHKLSCDQALAGFKTMADQAAKYFKNTQYLFAGAMAAALSDSLRSFERRCADLASPGYGKIHAFIDDVRTRARAAPACNDELEIIVEAAKQIAAARTRGDAAEVARLEADKNLHAALGGDACAMFGEQKEQAVTLLGRARAK